MAKQATDLVYTASIWHKPVGSKEVVFASANLMATTNLGAIQEAREWATPLLPNEYTVLRVTRGSYQIRAVRMEPGRAATREPVPECCSD